MDTHKNEPAGGSRWTALGHGVQATWSLVLRSPPSKLQCCDQAMSLIGPTRTCGHVRLCAAIGRETDIDSHFTAPLETRAYWGLTLWGRTSSSPKEIAEVLI